jgi:hypothetical protein
MPTNLIAYCEWIEEDLVPPAILGESFCVYGDGTGNHYSGTGVAAHYKLKLTLDRIGDSDYWEILLMLIQDGVLLDRESWHDFFIYSVGLFNTGYQMVQYPGEEGYLSMEASG